MSRFIDRMTKFKSERPGLISLVLAVMLAGGSVALLIIAFSQQKTMPSLALNDKDITAEQQTNQKIEQLSVPLLSFSQPTGISIGPIGVESELIRVGNTSEGAIEVPQGENYNKAAWYGNSPSPGQSGVAVIIGHVDSAQDGPSVFFELSTLRAGDSIDVKRKDGKTVTYTVQRVRQYDQDNFPSEDVYIGSTNKSELRLITCGGAFSETEGAYEDNIVVYAVATRVG